MTALDILRADLRRALDGLANADRAVAHALTERRAAQAQVDVLEKRVRLAELFPNGVPLRVGQRVEIAGFAPGRIADVYLLPLPPRSSHHQTRSDLRGLVQPGDRSQPPYPVAARDVEQ